MAMGKKRKRDRQASMWVATADLPTSAGHPFYARLNRVLDDAGFDTFVEAQCARFYADGIGRPSLAPGRYFRLLLLGYFEGLDSERAIAWRASDSLSIRQFLDFALHEAPPDHSTLSRTRRLIDLKTHQAVFTWVLQRLANAHLVEGHTIGIDATTLEANAAMRSIVRRDTGALVRGCGQAYALQTVEPVTYRCGTRRVYQARSSGSERYTRARPHAVAPMNCVPEDSRRRSTCTGRTHAPRARADGNQRLLPPSPSERLHPPDRPIAGT